MKLLPDETGASEGAVGADAKPARQAPGVHPSLLAASPLPPATAERTDLTTGRGEQASPPGRMAEAPRGGGAHEAHLPTVFSTLKALTETIALFGALAFAAGWSFITSYYAAFGINPLELDAGSVVTSLFALHVLYRSTWPILLVATVAFLTPTASRLLSRSGVAPVSWIVTVIVVVSLISFAVAGIKLGRSNALADMYETSSRLPWIGFTTDLTGDYPLCVSDGLVECRLLIHLKSAYYVFEPLIASAVSEPVSNIQVYIVPDSQVRFVRLSRGIDE